MTLEQNMFEGPGIKRILLTLSYGSAFVSSNRFVDGSSRDSVGYLVARQTLIPQKHTLFLYAVQHTALFNTVPGFIDPLGIVVMVTVL